ncbi:mannitol-1-phosphate 5-dehydrogenase [Longirhabdus pacifica]|uniref:mannitol-1-phosphate 5-dehydrogenase n=1 Tax=Longirhabdus pacifica TaxID=2305227 RepID=UPI001008FB76|nr:mannitol-1-phosphate 5-dehydrogenase [Longirhabdus pacifica]
MKALHFGAGNIGRGFIGGLLSHAGYEVCFVDVNEEIVSLLNEKRAYRVVLAEESSQETTITNVRAINSLTNPEQVIQEIAEADIITTAVGPHILEKIAGLIAKGLTQRVGSNSTPLNIIACENMIGGSAFLKEKVYAAIAESDQAKFDALFAFPNAAVDRIVPLQENEDKLMVSVEPFFEWVVDRSSMVGEVPTIEGVTYVEDLIPFIERKLFTVNTGHAAVAYLGHQAGLKTIKEALEDESVKQDLKATLRETGEVLIKKYGFDADQHQKYINKIVERFENPYINDDITRVARGPIRKLGPNDRLISPARQYYELLGKEPVHLAKTIAAALQYRFAEDEESMKLQRIVEKAGYKGALQEVSELESGHALTQIILRNIEAEVKI